MPRLSRHFIADHPIDAVFGRRQRANSVARDSRTTVTRIWPG
jgi:hypothetical protein